MKNFNMISEYAVIGSGPAGIIAVVRILEKILSVSTKITQARKLAQQILWIDPKFKVGAFGEEWLNVPGNTLAIKYQTVYKEIYAILNAFGVPLPEKIFELDNEDQKNPSLLKIAAEPLQWMTGQIMQLVTHIQGKVEKIIRTDRLYISINTAEGVQHKQTKRCILAIGGQPESLLPAQFKDKKIPLEVALDLNRLKHYIMHNSSIFKLAVLVQGSSHSAALAVWNLLVCGVKVMQIMNKDYLFYDPPKHENDGLKGKVADFIRDLIAGKIYADQWSFEIIPNGKFSGYDLFGGVVAAIGFQAAGTLTVDGISSDVLEYDFHTTETTVPGVFAVGIGYPPKAADGSKNVGISKFWPDLGEASVHWQKKPLRQNNAGQFFEWFGHAKPADGGFGEERPRSKL